MLLFLLKNNMVIKFKIKFFYYTVIVLTLKMYFLYNLIRVMQLEGGTNGRINFKIC